MRISHCHEKSDSNTRGCLLPSRGLSLRTGKSRNKMNTKFEFRIDFSFTHLQKKS